MKGTTIVVVPDGDDPTPRAITKIIPMSDGFSVVMPYHAANASYLVKMPVDYSQKYLRMALDECVTCEASNRVKLSIHFPGFAQFSGENNQQITSGRDPVTREPRGLGIVNKEPFQITSGPVANVGFWGLPDFREAVPKSGQIRLQAAQCLKRDVDMPVLAEYLIEIWMLPLHLRRRVADYLGQQTIRLVLPQFSGMQFPQDLQVIELPGTQYFLGVQLVQYRSTVLEPHDDVTAADVPSGFNLNGPSAMDESGQHWGLQALFPRPEGFPEARSLDRGSDDGVEQQ